MTAELRARLHSALQMAQWGGPLTPDAVLHCLDVAMSHEATAEPEGGEASDLAVFLALKTAAGKSSLQEGVSLLRKGFRIYAKR